MGAHAYLRPINLEVQKELFLQGSIDSPRFEYRAYKEGALSKDNELVSASQALRKSPTKLNIDRFRRLNLGVYGEPSTQLAGGIMRNIELKADNPKKHQLWTEVQAIVKPIYSHGEALPGVEAEVFLHYRTLFANYTNSYFDSVDKKDMSLAELMEDSLRESGLNLQGWSLLEVNDASHARVNHGKKRIIVGAQYKPRTKNAKMRIVAHEVYGHARRGRVDSLGENEGFAVLIEQLVGGVFKYRRAYRYLAGTLAYQGNSFRTVFEVIWRLMVIASDYTDENARSHAFNECTRIFRGGLMEEGGAVFLKDTIYFSANLALWKVLSRQLLSYDEFTDIIEGRRVVL